MGEKIIKYYLFLFFVKHMFIIIILSSEPSVRVQREDEQLYTPTIKETNKLNNILDNGSVPEKKRIFSR